VVLNAHFTSFGSGKVAAALGLLAPLLLKMAGLPTITLLHNIVETVDLEAAGFSAGGLRERVLRAIGSVVTWVVLRSDLVTTTMPRFVEILRAKYRSANVALTPHGAFGVPPPPRDVSKDGTQVMTFGKFGTYKKVEPLIEAIRILDRPDVELVVAGTDSPNTPGYLAQVEATHGRPNVRFTGYVPEEDVEATFREATVTVFPYTATTGSSGVLHQAGSFGCPPVLPRIGDLEDLIHEEGFTGSFFDPSDPADLARAIAELLDSAERRAKIAHHNHRAACGLAIDDVADWFLIHAGRLTGRGSRALLTPSREAAA
jgi:glycosyltransferase involved in cell wall biosynthesis